MAAPPPRINQDQGLPQADARPLIAQIKEIHSRVIPASLQEISSRAGYVENVVKYCESAYPSAPGGDKPAVAEQAEGYLTDALQAVRALAWPAIPACVISRSMVEFREKIK